MSVVVGRLCSGRYAAMQRVRLRIAGPVVRTPLWVRAFPATPLSYPHDLSLGGPPPLRLFSFGRPRYDWTHAVPPLSAALVRRRDGCFFHFDGRLGAQGDGFVR